MPKFTAKHILPVIFSFSILNLIGCGGDDKKNNYNDPDKFIQVAAVTPVNEATNVDPRDVVVKVEFSADVDPSFFLNQQASLAPLLSKANAVLVDQNGNVVSESKTIGDVISGNFRLARQASDGLHFLFVSYPDYINGGEDLSFTLTDLKTGAQETITLSASEVTALGLNNQQQNFQLLENGTSPVAGEVRLHTEVDAQGQTIEKQNIVVFRPLRPLKWNKTSYTVRIAAGVKEKDTSKNRTLGLEFTSKFSTLDDPKPAIENVDPVGINASSLRDITARTSFRVTTTNFNEIVSLQKIKIINGEEQAESVAVAIHYDTASSQIVIHPHEPLDYLQRYRVIIAGGANGLRGETFGLKQAAWLETDYRWEFSTAAPGVYRFSPSPANPDAHVVELAEPIVMELNFLADPNTVNSSTLRFTRGDGSSVPYQKVINGTKITLLIIDPSTGNMLNYSTKYTVTLTPGVQSVNGVHTSSDQVFSFTSVDRKIIFRSPSPDAQGVPLDPLKIQIGFNFDVDANINNISSNVIVESSPNGSWPGSSVAGGFTYDSSARVLTFTAAGLRFNDFVRVRVLQGLRGTDSATARIHDASTWQFKLTNQNLEVTDTSPFSNSFNVPVNSSVRVTFNYPVDPTSVRSDSLRVVPVTNSECHSTGPHPGTVTASGNSVFYLPTGPYDSFCTYRVEVSRGIIGQLNRQQENTKTFFFTTDGLDVNNVFMTFSYGNYIAADSEIEVVFNKDIACCVSNDWIRVYDEFGRRVSGSIFRSFNRLRFVPTQILEYDMAYEIRIESDDDGDIWLGPIGTLGEYMPTDYVTTFITESLPVDVIDYGPTGNIPVNSEFWVETNYSPNDPDFPNSNGSGVFPENNSGGYSSFSVAVEMDTDAFTHSTYLTPLSDLDYDTFYLVNFAFTFPNGSVLANFNHEWEVLTDTAFSLSSHKNLSGKTSPLLVSQGGRKRLSKAERQLKGCRANSDCVGSLKVNNNDEQKARIAAKKRRALEDVNEGFIGEIEVTGPKNGLSANKQMNRSAAESDSPAHKPARLVAKGVDGSAAQKFKEFKSSGKLKSKKMMRLKKKSNSKQA